MKIYRKKLRYEVYQLPDPITGKLSRLDRITKLPKVKYAAIMKAYESNQYYNVRGRKRKLKIYGVGILTEDNEYYYSEVRLRNSELTKRVIEKLKYLFLTRFHFNFDTKIHISDTMYNNKEDPMYMFISIFACALRIEVSQSNLHDRLSSLNSHYRYIIPTKKKKIGKHHDKRMIRELVEHNRFDFITEENWFENLDNHDIYSRTANIECAVGILFAYTMDLDQQSLRKHKERKLNESIIQMDLEQEKPNETQ